MQHRLAADLVSVIAPLAGPEGSVQAGENNLIVQATAERMQQIREVIRKLDTAPRQLLISVRQGSDRRDNNQSASISGRAGINNGRVILRPQTREDAQAVLRDGNGNVIRGGFSDENRRNQQNSTQQVRVIEGRPAFIQIGQQRPVVTRRVFPSVGRPVVIEEQGVQDITTGFRVLPRIHGSQFTLDISPQQAQLRGQSGIVDVQRLTTSVSGPLGQWVDIGGAVQQQNRQTDRLGGSASSQSSIDTSVLIKVDELP